MIAALFKAFPLKRWFLSRLRRGGKKLFCDCNAFHCAALTREMERKRKKGEGWQKTWKKHLTVRESPS